MQGWVRKQSSKDRKLDREGRKLLEVIDEVGMQIFNGAVERDIMGEFTYTGGRGSTVIDYVVEGLEEKERVVEMKIGDNCDSDHHPLEVYVREVGEKRMKGKGRKKVMGLDREGIEKYKEETKRLQIEGERVGKVMEMLKGKLG